MVICRFWKKGNCERGDQCRFEHPPGVGPQSQQGFGRPQEQTQPQNAFGLFNRINNNAQNYAPSAPRNQPAGRPPARDTRDSRTFDSYGVTAAVLEDDLTKERPVWLLSAYGPGKLPPVQLFGGSQIEQSPEEIRTLHYINMASGNPQQSAQLEAELAGRANQQVQMVLADTQGALVYLREGAKQHPNRRDICTQASTASGIDGPFSRHNRRNELRNQQRNDPRSASGNHGFAPAAPPAQPSGFGTSAGFGIGQPQQPSGFGGGFGQTQPPAAMPQMPQPSQPSGFGQPSMQSGFGQAQLTGGMVNGIDPNIHGTGFGPPPPAQQSMNGGFGSGMNSTGFAGGFGQQQPLQPQPNGPFATSQPQSSSGFDRPGPNHVIDGTLVAGKQMANGQRQPDTLPPASGDIASYTTRDATGRLDSWKGRPVQYDAQNQPLYVRPDGRLERIWFPDGPPNPVKVDTLGNIEYPSDTIKAFEHLREQGNFQDSYIPDLPPKFEMIRWDL